MRNYLVIILLILCNSICAQTVGLRIGMNQTFMNGYYGNIPYYGGGISGFHEKVNNNICFNAGVVEEFPLSQHIKNLTFESGLIIKAIGKEVSVSYSSFSMSRGGYSYHTASGSIKLWYLNIPVNARYAFVTGKIKLLYVLGPYIDMGIGGVENGSSIELGNKPDAMIRRFDYGVSTGFAISIKRFEIGLSGSKGLRNISSSSGDNIKNAEWAFYLMFSIPPKNNTPSATHSEGDI